MKTISILILALAITYASGACSNAVATYFGLDNVQTTAATGLGSYATCTSYATKAGTCCIAADVAKFQARTTARITAVKTAAGTRDAKFLAARKALAGKKTNWVSYLAAYELAKSNIATWTTTPKSPLVAADMTAFTTALTTIQATLGKFFTDYTTLQSDYATYQTKRDTCYSALLKAEAAAYCLACLDATDYTTQGVTVTANAITALVYGTDFKATIGAACVPYLEASESQSVVTRANYYIETIDSLTANMIKIAAGDTTGITGFTTAVAPITASKPPATQKPASNCAAASCDLINDDIFKLGKLMETDDKTLYGGSVVSTRRLQSSRNLAVTPNSFDPVAGEVVYTVTFGTDPGSHGNPKDMSALRVGVFSCIIAFFVALLI